MPEKLECRIVITYRKDKKIELGMFCKNTMRYEFCGIHGPNQRTIDKVIIDLRTRIESDPSLRLTWCERSE